MVSVTWVNICYFFLEIQDSQRFLVSNNIWSNSNLYMIDTFEIFQRKIWTLVARSGITDLYNAIRAISNRTRFQQSIDSSNVPFTNANRAVGTVERVQRGVKRSNICVPTGLLFLFLSFLQRLSRSLTKQNKKEKERRMARATANATYSRLSCMQTFKHSRSCCPRFNFAALQTSQLEIHSIREYCRHV